MQKYDGDDATKINDEIEEYAFWENWGFKDLLNFKKLEFLKILFKKS